MARDAGAYSSAAAPPEQRAPPAVREERRQPAAYSAPPARQQPPPADEEEDANDYDSDEASKYAICSCNKVADVYSLISPYVQYVWHDWFLFINLRWMAPDGMFCFFFLTYSHSA